jgi:hypothetical protein
MKAQNHLHDNKLKSHLILLFSAYISIACVSLRIIAMHFFNLNFNKLSLTFLGDHSSKVSHSLCSKYRRNFPQVLVFPNDEKFQSNKFRLVEQLQKLLSLLGIINSSIYFDQIHWRHKVLNEMHTLKSYFFEFIAGKIPKFIIKFVTENIPRDSKTSRHLPKYSAFPMV